MNQLNRKTLTLLASILFVAGCMPGSFRGSAGLNYDETLRTSVETLFRAAERGPGEFMKQVSSKYAGNRSELQSNVAELHARGPVSYSYTVTRSLISSDDPHVTVRFEQRRRDGSIHHRGQVQLVFVRENGSYKLYSLKGTSPFKTTD